MAPRTQRVEELLGRMRQRAEGIDPRQQEGITPIQQALGSLQQQAQPGQFGTTQQLPTGVMHPVPGAELTDTFGAPRGGGTRKHQGIDIFAESGTPVYAPVDGVADRGGYWNDTGGNSVSIIDANGNRHYFTHMDRPSSIKKGQQIRAGQVIGTTGTTGNAQGTPPHVHYSINEGRNNVINAYDFLTGGSR